MRFLNAQQLQNLSASVLLKLDGSKNVVGAVAGTDYVTPAAGEAHSITLAPGAGTVALGFSLINNTAASSNNQQFSPALKWSGQGWKTNATAASQSVDWIAYCTPIQGAANPGSQLIFARSINGGAYSAIVAFNHQGTIAGELAGNAATATSLATARNINGISFNGSADITIPIGVIGTAAFDVVGGSILNLVVKGIVDSVTYTGAGDYNVNFVSNEPDTDYCPIVIPDATAAFMGFPKSLDLSGFRALVADYTGAFVDCDKVRIVVVRLP